MVGKSCQNCKRIIGHLEELFFHYGYHICGPCKAKMESQSKDPKIANGNIETEIPIVEPPV